MRVNAIFILMSIQWAVLLYTLAFIIQENILNKKDCNASYNGLHTFIKLNVLHFTNKCNCIKLNVINAFIFIK